MARKPRSKTTDQKPSKLLEAIKFVGMACKDVGPINETHIFLGGKWAAASNGVITIAAKIEEEIFACPQTKLLTEALSKCGEQFAITQLETSLSVKGDKLKADIPCINSVLLSIPSPDDPVGDINDTFKTAIEVVGILINDNAQEIIPASILVNGSSVISSDRTVMLEYWHGSNLPVGLTLPKSIIKPLNNAGKKLTKFGFSPSSITFYFEDESWIKTQLFIEKWPENVNELLNIKSNQLPLPKDFWEGVAAVAPFSPDGLIYFGPGIMQSHSDLNAGATFEVSGLPAGPVFSLRQLTIIKPYAETVDFFTPGRFGSTMLTFFGPKIRGAIAGKS